MWFHIAISFQNRIQVLFTWNKLLTLDFWKNNTQYTIEGKRLQAQFLYQIKTFCFIHTNMSSILSERLIKNAFQIKDQQMMLGSHLYSLKYMPSLNLAVFLSPNKNYGYVGEGLLMILPLPIWCLEERDEGEGKVGWTTKWKSTFSPPTA